jgi:hypothetical protein
MFNIFNSLKNNVESITINITNVLQIIIRFPNIFNDKSSIILYCWKCLDVWLHRRSPTCCINLMITYLVEVYEEDQSHVHI